MDDKKIWGAADRQTGPTLEAGSVRETRDLTDSERGQILSGYRTVDEEEGLDARREAQSVSGSFVASSSERPAGEFSGIPGTASPLGGSSEAGSFGIGSSGDTSFRGTGLGAEPLSPEAPLTAKEKVKEKVHEQVQVAKDKAIGAAREQVNSRKDQVAEQLEGASGMLQERFNEQATRFVSQFASVADSYVSRASALLREKNADELMVLAQREFKSRPLAVAAGAFALGFLGARLLRS